MNMFAEDFNVAESMEILNVVFYGGYATSNQTLETDAFTIIFREDAGGLPGALGCVPGAVREVSKKYLSQRALRKNF